MAVPNVLVISYSDFDVSEIVRGILKTKDLPNSLGLYDEDVGTFPWRVETKYYSADVHICTVVNDKFGSSTEILENMQALVTYFDSQMESSFNRVKMLHSLINGFEPDVRLLVCNNCSDSTPVTRMTVQNWCLQNGYELVELCPEETSDSDDDFAETTGMDRIIQALHSHTWSNLVLKGKPAFCPSRTKTPVINDDETVSTVESTPTSSANLEKDELFGKEAFSESDSQTTVEASGFNTETAKEEDLEVIIRNLEADDALSFEGLFERFQIMKDRAKDMKFEDRKVYAEQVAIAFWKAIGGDDEEIAGLSNE